jgi:hypothetical protein
MYQQADTLIAVQNTAPIVGVIFHVVPESVPHHIVVDVQTNTHHLAPEFCRQLQQQHA